VVVAGLETDEHVAVTKTACGDAVELKIVPVRDHPSSDLSIHFADVHTWVQSFTSGGVLVACREGASRSVTLALAHMMMTARQRLEECFCQLAEKRWRLWPNSGFAQQLSRLDLDLRGVCTSARAEEESGTVRRIAIHSAWATGQHNGRAATLEEVEGIASRLGTLPWGDLFERLKLEVLGVLDVGAFEPVAKRPRLTAQTEPQP